MGWNKRFVTFGSRRSSRTLVTELGLLAGLLVLVLSAIGANTLLERGAEAPQAARTSGAIDLSRGFGAVSHQVEGAIVNIRAEQVVHSASDPREELFRRFFGDEFGSQVPRDRTQKSLGSGFIADPAGFVLTNNHVVENASRIKVKLSDGRLLDAKVVGTDPQTDLAVIKINGSKLATLPLGDSSKVDIGDWVMAFGSPFGFEKTMTVGVISAKGRVIGAGNYDDFLQTDAAINPGNSGGPLVNLRGEAIGINTMIVSQSGGFSGVGFAIPSTLAQGIFGQLVKSGKVTRGWLGVTVQPLTPELAKSFGVQEGKGGVLVADVEPGSPAAAAGLRSGDVILDYNGRRLESGRDLSFAVADSKVGVPSKLRILRQGQEMTIEAKVGQRPEETTELPRAEPETPEQGKLGIAVEAMTQDRARQLGLSTTDGALITEVRAGSPAEEGGVAPGDVVREINRTPVRRVQDLVGAIRNLKSGSTVLLKLERQGRMRYVAFTLS